jgi:glycosyltransferase involved in cell wall biosynthesis
VYLVDPHLRDGRGHYLGYALSVYGEARRRGDRFLALVPRDAGALVRESLPTEPVLEPLRDIVPSRNRLLNGARAGANLVRQSAEVFAALRRATRGLPRGPAVYFFPNASTMDIVGYALWIRSRQRGDDTSYVLLLRYDYHVRARHPGVLAGWLRLAFRLLAERRAEGSVRITSDSAPLARLFAELDGRPVGVLPIPHSPHECPPAAPAGRGACHLVYVGGWRGEQGVRDLVDALLAVRADFEAGRFTATIQANPSPADREACEARDRLRAAAIPGVELLEDILDGDRFLRCLASADLVLAPYDSDAYRYRTSGIFAEAVALGKPVITTRGSWMSGELGGDEALLFDSGDPDGLARALRSAAASLPELNARAARRRAAWTEFHHPRTFYDLLVGPAEDSAAGGRARGAGLGALEPSGSATG